MRPNDSFAVFDSNVQIHIAFQAQVVYGSFLFTGFLPHFAHRKAISRESGLLIKA